MYMCVCLLSSISQGVYMFSYMLLITYFLFFRQYQGHQRASHQGEEANLDYTATLS